MISQHWSLTLLGTLTDTTLFTSQFLLAHLYLPCELYKSCFKGLDFGSCFFGYSELEIEAAGGIETGDPQRGMKVVQKETALARSLCSQPCPRANPRQELVKNVNSQLCLHAH